MEKFGIRKLRGFTLVEACVTTAIAALLAASAAPSMTNLMEQQRLQGTVEDLTLALTLARTEAITAGRRVVIAPRTASDWTSGWRVFVDANDDGRLDDTEPVLYHSAAIHRSISITTQFGSGSNDVLSYGRHGFLRRAGSNGLLMGKMVIGNGTKNRVVCFGATRVRVAEGTTCS